MFQYETIKCFYIFIFIYFSQDRNIPTFHASLKDDRDLWFTFLSEISAAQKNAHKLRDDKLIDQGKSNIVLAQALLMLQYPIKTVEGKRR